MEFLENWDIIHENAEFTIVHTMNIELIRVENRIDENDYQVNVTTLSRQRNTHTHRLTPL